MVNSQLAKSFLADKQGFFSRFSSNEPTNIRMAKLRFQSRTQLEIVTEDAFKHDAQEGLLNKNKLYVERCEDRFKYQFIADSNQPSATFANNLSDVLKQTAKEADKRFDFVAKHRKLIEQEFSDLYAALIKQGNNRDEFWLYCYFICLDLENYYLDDAYPNPVEAAKYAELRKSLEYRCTNGVFRNEDCQNGNEWRIGLKLKAAITDLLETPWHTAAIRGWLGFINLYRILFVFSRLAVKQSLVLANQLKWLESLSHLFNMPFDMNSLISRINAPNGVFNLLSVGLFEVRLCIILSEIMKHALFAPTKKESSRSKSERLKQELFERFLDIYNDLAWSIVNTMCNFGYLADPIAFQLTAVFLLFDALALITRYYLARQDYLLKKEQYDLELQAFDMTDQTPKKQLLQEQKHQLDIEWGANGAKLLFLSAGAFLLMGGFSATFLLATPAGGALCFMVACTVAVAMFLSSGQYQAYTKAKLIQQSSLPNDKQSLEDVSHTRWSFYKAMAKNTVMPLVMVTAFAIYWPGALVLALAYIVNENRGTSPVQHSVIPKQLTADQMLEADVGLIQRTA